MKISVIVKDNKSSLELYLTLNSLIKQTIQDFEVIIFTHERKDRHNRIITKFINKFKGHVMVIRQDNLNKDTLLNEGINIATGEHIEFLNSGEILKPAYLELMYKENQDNL